MFSIKKAIFSERCLRILLVLILIFSLALWVTRGRYLYQGQVYYTSSDTGMPVIKNVQLISSDEQSHTYTASLFGIFPLGEVQVNQVKRPEVTLGTGCVVLRVQNNNITITGFTSASSPAEQAGIQVLDIIRYIDNKQITCFDDISSCLEENTTGYVDVKVERDGKLLVRTVKLSPDKKLGVYIDNHAFAIGTMSFITDNMKFCAIGHNLDTGEISDTETVLYWATQQGDEMEITDVISDNIGISNKSSSLGVTGTARPDWVLGEKISLGWSWEITEGDASINIVSDGEMLSKNIKILGKGLYNNKEYYRVYSDTDTFCRGMSGSCIIQNNRLIGILIGVNVNDPHEGYFVPAEDVYSEFIGFEVEV